MVSIGVMNKSADIAGYFFCLKLEVIHNIVSPGEDNRVHGGGTMSWHKKIVNRRKRRN